jgi:glycosyltransferase involved in cell wall biosynthesis
MKIAINCIYHEAGGGIGEYIYNLVKELVNLDKGYNFVFYITKESEIKFKDLTKGIGVIKIFPFDSKNKIKRALFQQYFWKHEEEIENFDVFHSPFFYGPKFKKAKTILTVHDLRFLNYPKSYEITRYLFLRYAVKKSINKAHNIIAISNFTKREIINHYKVKAEKVKVIHEAVNIDGFLLNNNSKSLVINREAIQSNNFILAVGHLEPRKNYNRLIDAYLELPAILKSKFKLVIVGKKNHDFNSIISKINKSNDVIYLDFVTREELIWLYANCKIHVFPSFYEGFGFSSLEAGLFGKPTIGANQSSIPEIAGKGGIYFDPFSINDIAEKIQKLLSENELYETLSKGALENVDRFSWVENAKETIKIYDQLYGYIKIKTNAN